MIEIIEKWVDNLLILKGIPESVTIYLRLLILIVVLGIIAYVGFLITKYFLVKIIYRFVKRTPAKWDDVIAEERALDSLAHITPAIIIASFLPSLFTHFPSVIPVTKKLIDIYIIIVTGVVFISILKAVELGISTQKLFESKPISSYFQVIKIIIYIAIGIIVISLLIGRSPIYLLSAFGAMTAILMLIFKDTILGLVASVQISANDMVRVGDWIEMPKFNADGNVTAINLNIVKVVNADKTVTTIPTYYFVTDSFKNRRGLSSVNVRRIKRSIYINAHSVKFVSAQDREKFSKVKFLESYITYRQADIESFNKQNEIDTGIEINGRRMTNLGIFRKYIELYLENNPRISKEQNIVVRQLSSEDRGIPIEIYCFSNTANWLEYEEIQSDIFDHLYASVGYFDLEIFQKPGGSDFAAVLDK